MVHFREVDEYDQPKDNPHTNYWKLKRFVGLDDPIDSLQALVPGLSWSQLHDTPDSPQAVRARHLYERMQRGLLLYEKCTDVELRTFCIARQVDFASQSRGRKAMMNALGRADENALFPKFLDLPPELREHVYSHHFASFETERFPCEPPITRASRLLRQETLPLFYETCEFELRWELGDPKTFHGCSDEVLSRVRSLILRPSIFGDIRTVWKFRIQQNGEVQSKHGIHEDEDQWPDEDGWYPGCFARFFDDEGEGYLRTKKILDERAEALSIILKGRGDELRLTRSDEALLAKLAQPVHVWKK